MSTTGSGKTTEEAGGTESVRDRILNTARELFYREGVRAVGVDTVVAQSGVAKTSLYRWFSSKDVLIAAVLEAEAKDRWDGWDYNLANAGSTDPREQLRAEFKGIARYVSSSKFRGCPFMNVITEFPDPEHPARKLAIEVTEELRRRIRGLIDQLDVRDPVELTDQLVLLVDGAFSSAQAMGRQGPQKFLLAAAEALIEAQLKKA
ncbi:MAG TPA: TetR/AcrR family transcriptional regulator [Povalibacter sp.]|nr:TetR/AcrR family transcriptional regulator [Povalibacter sp.]